MLSFGRNIPKMQAGTATHLSFSGGRKPSTRSDIFFGNTPASAFVLGTPVGAPRTSPRPQPRKMGASPLPVASPGFPVVNTAKRDGSSNFLNAFSGFGAALLQSIGGTPEPTPQVQTVAYSDPTPPPFDMKTMAIFALAGVGIYLVAKS